ncbi:MAG: tetratricopeptide repeat protein, partial [Planctomycetota bacterium]
RHRLAVAAGTLSLIALLVAFERARRSERNAQSEAMHAQMEADSFHGIADFLMDAFLPVQPAQDAEWQARARARILAHRDRVHRQFAESPHERANLLDTLGQVCLRLDLTVDAESLMREAFVLRTESYGRASLEAALSLRSLGQLRYRTGAFDDGAQLLAEALAIHRATPNSTHADVAALANDLAACLHNLGRDDEALSLHREALALRRVQAPGSLSVAESLNNLAGVHLARSEFAAAVTVLREALSIRSGILGDAHVLTLQTMSNLASALWRNQDFDEARSIMQRAEVGYVALGGDGEDGLGILLANLAAMQLQVRDLDGASDSLERAMVLQRRRLGNDHPVLAATFAKLANVAHARSLDEVARAHWQEAMRVRQASPTSPFDLAETLLGQSKFLLDVGDFDAAAESAAAALAAFRRSDRADAVSQGRAELVLGASFAQLGRLSVAREHLLEAARLLKDANSSTPAERARVQELLDDVARRAGG